MVAPGVPVLLLADMSGWLVKTTDLTELSVVSVGVGLPVEISVDAIPDVTLTGTVTDIATVSELVRGDVVYEVTIRLDEAQARRTAAALGNDGVCECGCRGIRLDQSHRLVQSLFLDAAAGDEAEYGRKQCRADD
jgi:hypothetical protein